MGENYYLPDGRHVGKTGRVFCFQAGGGIRSAADWRKEIAEAGAVVDESGQHLDPEEFWDIAAKHTRKRTMLPLDHYHDLEGWEFCIAEFS